ncbi:MAG: AAA family ATPase [Anaerolineales bacterium]|nr:AAA family ATPase [Anaerolineales bacterium]
MARFLKGLRQFTMDEALAARQEIARIWAQSPAERAAAGRAITGVRIIGFLPDGLLELACDRNLSRFREGDILCLNQGDPYAQPNETVTLERDDGSRLLVSGAAMGHFGNNLGNPSDHWVLDESQLDLSPWILEALDEVGDTITGRARILPLVMGHLRPAMDSHHYERGLAIGYAAGLNHEQSEALAQAYATNLTYLIQGPPGTGKTRLLAHYVQALVRDGERVLITALTHRAINNALNKLWELDPTIPMAKIGQPASAADLLAPNFEKFVASPMADMAGGYVFGATPFALRTSRLGGVEFDTVVFDEASQLTIPLAMMGMVAGRRFIFIGDQQQLPPVLSQRRRDHFHDSIFGRLSDHGYSTMLTTTYRLSRELAAWPSRHFYENQLVADPSAADRRVDYPRPPAQLLHILDPDDPLIFWNLDQRNTTVRSRQEAAAVADLISALLRCGFPPEEIAVIVPYRAQAREVRGALQQLGADPERLRQIVVDTVERMQGQERDLVILSLTTSSAAYAARQADFFFQPERLNVAVTRARKKLIIIGSRQMLAAPVTDPEIAEHIELLRDLLASCTTIYGIG